MFSRKKKKRRKVGFFRNFFEGVKGISEGTKKGILIILLFVFGGICFLSLFGLAGSFGIWINGVMLKLFGVGRPVFPIVMLVISYLLLYTDKYEMKKLNYTGICLLFISFVGLVHLIRELYFSYALEQIMEKSSGGGYAGFLITKLPLQFTGMVVSLILFFALFLTGILLAFNTSIWKVRDKASLVFLPIKKIRQFIGWWRFRRKEFVADEFVHEENSVEESAGDNEKSGEIDLEKRVIDEEKIKEQQELIPKRLYRKIDLSLELLESKFDKPTSGDIKKDEEIIKNTLESFSINVEMGDINIGPTVTQYTLKPTEGVKLSQITTLHNDLALSLAAHPIRIEAPIPGKALVGIEVPNKKKAIVGMKEVLQSPEFKKRTSNLMLALGKDVSGKSYVSDLIHMPHLLIAGRTGSGKSICINSIILSLLYQNTPETLKFIMVDPKRVELTVYNGLNYLITPVITDVKKTVNALKWAICEMERRFEVLSEARKRDIASFNSEAKEKLPYIVIIIDELADLMSISGAEVEAAIIRLAQMARAVGIHLILATQRPSVNVITGLIKANIPARIAFSVASLIDSRTILDNSGAEKLLGNGDMLFLTSEISKPKRLQGAYVGDKEIKRIAKFIKEHTEEDVEYNEDVVELKHKAQGVPSGDDDDEDLLEEAKEIILAANRASTSLLQRRLKVGYSRAARLIDSLEEQGFVSPADGSKPRRVIRE